MQFALPSLLLLFSNFLVLFLFPLGFAYGFNYLEASLPGFNLTILTWDESEWKTRAGSFFFLFLFSDTLVPHSHFGPWISTWKRGMAWVVFLLETYSIQHLGTDGGYRANMSSFGS